MAEKFLIGSILLIVNIFVQGEKLRMKLFTPGPAVTSQTVKNAMPDDVGIEELYFINIVKNVTSTLLDIAGLSRDRYLAIPMQGSATYSNEAMIRAATPKLGKVLVLSNGFFGDELERICQFADISFYTISWDEGVRMNLSDIEDHLKGKRNYSTVAMVHHETSTTMLNPLTQIGQLVKKYLPEAAFVVDAVGSYGCFPFDFEAAKVDFLTMAPHRCLQAFLGYAFVILRKERLLASKDNCRSYVLNIYDQWNVFEIEGHFRFTTPAQVIVATYHGMIEYLNEGKDNRFQRYDKNRDVTRNGLIEMGFVPFIPVEYATSVTTAFYWPNHAFNFTDFQRKLQSKGTFIYSTTLTKAEIFRVGHIGNISAVDCEEFLATVKSVLSDMGIGLPLPLGPYKTKT